jgi:ATP-binding protein involved in chromosome partitioning
MPETPDLAKKDLIDALREVIDPDKQRDVASLGYVRDVACSEGVARVSYMLPATAATEPLREALHKQTRTVLMRLAGVSAVEVEFAVRPGQRTDLLPGVKHVIAVGAGKGGVGKSTVAALAAAGLARMGRSVGILDGDVYGPSIPRLTGTDGERARADEDGRICPAEKDGLRIMSMGYFVPPNEAVIWRGPLAQKYVAELLERGDWGELDCLIVDLPPGTGDIPLTLAQTVPLTGAVVVCTPQDLALTDALKALRMYQKLGVEPLGIVENMSYYVCPQCGHRDEIFSHGGARKAAEALGVPFLGGIPLNVAIREYGDAGRLLANFTEAPRHVAEALEEVVRRLAEQIDRRARERGPSPKLSISD